MSEIKNDRLGLYGAEHSKCNHMMGYKGLNSNKSETIFLGTLQRSKCAWNSGGNEGADSKGLVKMKGKIWEGSPREGSGTGLTPSP